MEGTGWERGKGKEMEWGGDQILEKWERVERMQVGGGASLEWGRKKNKYQTQLISMGA